MRVAIANGSICMNRGGAERSAIRLADALRERGHAAHLLTTFGREGPVYPLDPCLPVHFFPQKFHDGDMAAVARGGDLLRECKIDILISFESDWKHMLWQHCAASARAPFVCSERLAPFLSTRDAWEPSSRRNFFRHCAGIHELLPCYLRYIPDEFMHRAFVIANAAPDNLAHQCPGPHAGRPVLLFLGRFAAQKRPLLLLRAFALLIRDFPDWTLRFAGWGEERENMEALRRELGLEGRVEIREAAANVEEEYKAASIYCLPTQFEGFPNSVLEAMSWGLPVVGIGDCAGMAAVVRPGLTGLLAPRATPESLAAALRPLMASEKPRLRMGHAGWEDCRQNYAAKHIFDEWERQLYWILENWRKTRMN